MASVSPPTRLVVFSDDWGRHPSSCQHLVRRLLPRYSVLWVNTIGTRVPGVSRGDIGKIMVKLRQWVGVRRDSPSIAPRIAQSGTVPGQVGDLRVVTPAMYPGFRRAWQRRLNARLISRSVNRALGDGGRTIAITTLPITADLVGRLRVDRWVYYCVDDFSAWPGIDEPVMTEMERALVAKVDRVIAVSETLRQRMAGLGAEAALLTHGIDLDHWGARDPHPSPLPGGEGERGQRGERSSARPDSALPSWCAGLPRPIFLFWGLIDRRLDTAWCRALLESTSGTLVLVGPQQDPDPALLVYEGGQKTLTPALSLGERGQLVMPGAVSYEELPGLAAWADALVMPYADLPVTRAMQPLKFKEYLAAGYPDRGKPVVARALPATRQWADAADVVESPEQFVAIIRQRLVGRLPASQVVARRRLADETWEKKAAAFEAMVLE